MDTEKVIGQLLHCIAISWVLTAPAGFPAMAADPLPGAFAGLRFPHSGVARRDIGFRSFPQTCLYAETPTKWSTDWGKMGCEPYPYLYQIPPNDANVRGDVVFEDFESGTYDNWRAEGKAFTKNTFPINPITGRTRLAAVRWTISRYSSWEGACRRLPVAHTAGAMSRSIDANSSASSWEPTGRW
jgi:hypothetical protein